MNTKSLSDEYALFDIIRRTLDYSASPAITTGVESMDDCAILKITDNVSLAVTSDFVRGSGFTLFELGQLDYYDVGYYLISANLSDLASVGAKPLGLTTIVRYADKMNEADFQSVFNGMKDSADRFNVPIVGGDIGSYKADVFAATAFGLVDSGTAMLRKNVQDGDLLCITGTVGKAITALTYFKEVKAKGLILSPEDEQHILNAWKKPPARIPQGLLLRQNSLANACQDISDGLKATIEQMSGLSQRYFNVYTDQIPIDPVTYKVADFLGVDPVQIALSASVDFELLFTIPAIKRAETETAFAAQGFALHIIGETNGLDHNVLIDADGTQRPIPGTVWKQQTGTDFIHEIIK